MPKQESKVVKIIDEYRIVFNRGERDGINLNERYLVFEIGEEIFDPDTGESLGRIEIIKGKGKVTHIQEKMSTLETYEQDKLKVPQPKGALGMAMAMGYGADYEYVTRSFEDATVGDIVKKIG